MFSRRFCLLEAYSTQKDISKDGEDLCAWMLEKSNNGRKAVDLGTHETCSQLREGTSKLILEESIFFKNIDFKNKQVEEGKGTEKGDNAQTMLKAD